MDQASEFAGDPAEGRVYTAGRAVRGPDVSMDGRLRLDALARYLQEAAEGDLADVAWTSAYGWVVRKCAVRIAAFPRLGQRLQVRTFCSAIGPRWAERTTTLASADGDLVQARAVWAAVSRESARPCSLGPEFCRVYGPSAGGRSVSVRLSHPRLQRRWPAIRGRCASPISTPPATSTTRSTGPPSRTPWPGSAGCRAAQRSSFTAPLCPAASPGCCGVPHQSRPGPGC
jgi:acyl-CoA thioesterase FadM